MSAATSPATGRRYGVERVCAAWKFPRSSFYVERARRRVRQDATSSETTDPAVPQGFLSDGAPVGDVPSLRRPHDDATAASQRSATEGESAHSHAPTDAALGPRPASMARTGEADVARSEHGGTVGARGGAVSAGPRGPRPKVSDARVLELVRADLERSPFQGEGHRKVHARLKRAGHRVFRRQVLRVMRDAQLLSPHRAPQGEVRAHDGRITTDEPNVMWGTDGMRVETVEDGWVWIFAAVEHWNGEVMGWHVTARGDRFAALEPIKQGLTAIGRGVGRDAGRGLSLRMDHGTQYTSEHFGNELRYWGIARSFGYVAEPETNGVIERFNRTLKAEVIRGRVFRDVAALRAAVGEFVARYNASWLLEKNGYRSPSEMRAFNTERLAA